MERMQYRCNSGDKAGTSHQATVVARRPLCRSSLKVSELLAGVTGQHSVQKWLQIIHVKFSSLK